MKWIGNNIGDLGAKMLNEVLKCNSTLTSQETQKCDFNMDWTVDISDPIAFSNECGI